MKYYADEEKNKWQVRVLSTSKTNIVHADFVFKCAV